MANTLHFCSVVYDLSPAEFARRFGTNLQAACMVLGKLVQDGLLDGPESEIDPESNFRLSGEGLTALEWFESTGVHEMGEEEWWAEEVEKNSAFNS